MLERECSKRILMRNIVSAYAFAFLIGTSACSPSPEPSTRTNPNANLHAEFHSIIDEYVLWTHGWAKEVVGDGIRVNAVLPGPILQPGFIDRRRLGSEVDTGRPQQSRPRHTRRGEDYPLNRRRHDGASAAYGSTTRSPRSSAG